MLDTAQLQQLKQTNISVDSEKTKDRITELWQGLKIKQKQAIRELAGITAQPIYRTQETGNISARLAIAFAQSLDVSPSYLTGEADEPGDCSDAAIREMLLKYGYRDLAASMEPQEGRRKYVRREKPAPEEAPAEVFSEDEGPAEEPQDKPALQLPPGSDTLTAEDLQQLVFALYVQAKAGIANAKEKLDQIKLIILS
ncbi:MAG: hypothetical protein LBB75_05520 [Oscillospiraceae bacterium]|jgi:hypothetical protein|nr:hypothetical protein [Oscillospiraceae bacterium]